MLMTVVTCTTTFAQSIMAPPNVQIAFWAKYPQVQLKNWKKENGQYIASFVMEQRDCEAAYDHAGNWLSTLIIYSHIYNRLTPAMRDELRNSMYAGYHSDQAKCLLMPNMDILLLTLDNDNGNMSAYEDAGLVDMTTVYFSHSGR